MSIDSAIGKIQTEVVWKKAELAKLRNRIRVVEEEISKYEERIAHLIVAQQEIKKD